MRKPCCDKEGNNKGAWSKQEDQKLMDYITTHGEGCWSSLPKAAGLHRCGKSCRLRWINYLRPDIKRGNFAQDEEDLIIKLHALLGNRWSLIAGRLPGRTDNEVKNYWNTHLRKKLTKMGIDPSNHRLNQTLPRPQQPKQVSTKDITSPKSLNITTCKQERHSDQEKDGLSENGSCLEHEISSASNLNLDLTIATPSSLINSEKKTPNFDMEIGEAESKSLPTLLLFR